MTVLKYNQALVALGANLAAQKDSPIAQLQDALAKIVDQGFEIVRKSQIYCTPAFPAGAGPDYANAAVQIATLLPPSQILSALHQIEARAGRVREQRWGARVLDLDLLAVGDVVKPDLGAFQTWADLAPEQQLTLVPDRLILPHPRLHERAFVLVPLMDIAPDWVHPVFGRTVRQMHDALPSDALAAIRPIPV